MVKPKFSLRINPSPILAASPGPSLAGTPAWHKRKSIAHATVNREFMNLECQQIEEAIRYCNVNNVRGWAALKTGQFPLIKDGRTINSHLDGLVKNGSEKEYCSVLTVEEENALVRHIKNKNRYVN